MAASRSWRAWRSAATARVISSSGLFMVAMVLG
jgi:hypothetical protein